MLVYSKSAHERDNTAGNGTAYVNFATDHCEI